jgi:hypothetical protein
MKSLKGTNHQVLITFQQNSFKQEVLKFALISTNLLILFGKEKLPEQWKESIIVSVYKKGDKTDCSNYHRISLLSTAYKILSNVLLSRLTPYVEEILGDHQCGFQCNRSNTDHIFCIRQTLEKKWEYNVVVHQLFVNFKKAYDSVGWEVLYNILIQFGIPLKLERLIKTCLNKTYSRVWVGIHLSDMFPVKNGLKQGNNFVLQHAIRKA